MTTTERWQWLAVALVGGGLIYLLAPALTPFAIAALFAYLWDPVVDRLERLGLSRNFSVSLVFFFIIVGVVALILLVIPFTERQIAKFLEQLPRWLAWIQAEAQPQLEKRFGITLDFADPNKLIEMLSGHWREAGGVATALLAKVSKSGLTVLGWVAQLVLIPVVTFYLLRDWDVLVARVNELLPRTIEPTISRLARESDEVLGAFLRGQLSVMLALGTLYAVGLWAIGIDVGPLIGMIAGLISFVPYLGAIVGVGMALIAAVVQYQDWTHVIMVLAVFGVGQTIEGYVLVPKLVGDKIGLHPVAVIFAILAGGELFGFLGVLLALPAAAVFMVVLRYLHEKYTASTLYQAEQPQPEVSGVVVVSHGSVVAAGDLEPLPTVAQAAPGIVLPGGNDKPGAH
ncbi:putative PurR-regulated permease PerM [Tahibacter aquaticus]|uniref:Putative PurR-regulated permease PerM n=1 Tax=Tahibacter aquaticus TaxID=520092 RepID=A0A4R6Z2H8_9GAMM|nr:AI-2E family transporter [Tahibacter aquaticus]TDR45805.1 putative PurR-regulated permease PerM [Tahibacter aquaticus]